MCDSGPCLRGAWAILASTVASGGEVSLPVVTEQLGHDRTPQSTLALRERGGVSRATALSSAPLRPFLPAARSFKNVDLSSIDQFEEGKRTAVHFVFSRARFHFANIDILIS